MSAAIVAGAVAAVVAVTATGALRPPEPAPTTTEATSPTTTGTTEATAASTTAIPTTVAPGIIRPASIVATDIAPPGFDFSGATVTYEPGNTVDGDLTTTWRAPGVRHRRTADPRPARDHIYHRVGLLPGYAKVDELDGTDRFTQNRRISSVRWLFTDGAEVVQDFEPRPEVQYIDVTTTSATVVVEILATSEPGERDFAAISEIEVHGTSS